MTARPDRPSPAPAPVVAPASARHRRGRRRGAAVLGAPRGRARRARRHRWQRRAAGAAAGPTGRLRVHRRRPPRRSSSPTRTGGRSRSTSLRAARSSCSSATRTARTSARRRIGILNQALADGGRRAAGGVHLDRPRAGRRRGDEALLRYLPSAYTGLSGTPDEMRRNAATLGRASTRRSTRGAPAATGWRTPRTSYLVDAPWPAAGATSRSGPRPRRSRAALERAARRDARRPSEPARDRRARRTAAARDHASSHRRPGPRRAVAGARPPATCARLVVSSSVWAGGQSPGDRRADRRRRHAARRPAAGRGRASSGRTGRRPAPTSPAIAILPDRREPPPRTSRPSTSRRPAAWRLDLVDGRRRDGLGARRARSTRGHRPPSARPAPGHRHADARRRRRQRRSRSRRRRRPDLRFYQASTADARAAGRPYVLVVDSARFKVSPACGRALSMIRYLLDRWARRRVHPPRAVRVPGRSPASRCCRATSPTRRSTSRRAAFGLGDATWPATDDAVDLRRRRRRASSAPSTRGDRRQRRHRRDPQPHRGRGVR